MKVRLVDALYVAVALTTTLTLAACGGGTSGSATGGSTAEAPATLKVGLPAKVQTLDPDQAYNYADVNALALIGGTLYHLLPDGTVEPGLAASGEAAADGLSWTFDLRPDLKFSDGTDLTAEDVAASYDRAMTDKASAYAGLVEKFEKVTAKDTDTLTIELKQPYPSLPEILSQPALMVMPEEGLAKGDSFFDSPVSAGPFRMTSTLGASTTTFEANENYWGPAPVSSAVNFSTVADANTRVQQVQSGQLDIAFPIPAELTSRVTGSARAVAPIGFGWTALVPRNTVAPFDNVKVRRAVSDVLDRPKMAEVAWAGLVDPLKGFWPSTTPGYDESISTEPDLDAAKAALEGTACDSGCEASLIYDTQYPSYAQLALIARQNLAEIGIDVSVEALDSVSFTNRIYGGDFELALIGTYDYVPTPDGLLNYNLLSGGGQQANFSGYASPQMDDLIERVGAADGDERQLLLADINSLFVTDAPYAVLNDTTLPYATRLDDSVAGVGQTSVLYVASTN